MEKTNVMRILDKYKINYKEYYYDTEVAISGVEVASILNQNQDKVFKTLVTVRKIWKTLCFYDTCSL